MKLRVFLAQQRGAHALQLVFARLEFGQVAHGVSPVCASVEVRPSGRCGLRSGELLGRRLHRLHDVLVAGAAAQVAGQAVADLLLAGIRGSPAAAGRRAPACRACSSRTAGRAPRGRPAASACSTPPCSRPSTVSTLGAIALHREHGAGLDRHAVEVDRAGAAVRGLAADVRPGVRQALAQRVDQQLARLHRHVDGLAVELETILWVFAMVRSLGQALARDWAICSARRAISPAIAVL